MWSDRKTWPRPNRTQLVFDSPYRIDSNRLFPAILLHLVSSSVDVGLGQRASHRIIISRPSPTITGTDARQSSTSSSDGNAFIKRSSEVLERCRWKQYGLLCKFVSTLSQCNSLSYTSPSALPWSRTRYDDFTSHDKTTRLLTLL